MFVVLARLVSTVLQLMRHSGSHRLSGSPRSSLESHTAAVAFGFETNPSFVFHSSKSQPAFSLLAAPHGLCCSSRALLLLTGSAPHWLCCCSSRGQSAAALWQRMTRKTRGRAYRRALTPPPHTGLRLPTQGSASPHRAITLRKPEGSVQTDALD